MLQILVRWYSSPEINKSSLTDRDRELAGKNDRTETHAIKIHAHAYVGVPFPILIARAVRIN